MSLLQNTQKDTTAIFKHLIQTDENRSTVNFLFHYLLCKLPFPPEYNTGLHQYYDKVHINQT
jgi:hypothetical protein